MGEGISQGRMQSANACRLNVTKNEQGGGLFFSMIKTYMYP